MRSFFIGLQFLTRISIVHQENWTVEDFGRSVKSFPLVGAVLGACYALVAYCLCIWLPTLGWEVPRHLSGVLLLLLPLLLTGGLHADGFMDTMDGVFSGRSRERKLEIMKDSRVGANGVTSFVLLLLLNWAILLDMPPFWLVPALFVMPVIGRCMMVGAITCFPYARPEGMGKAFAEYAGKKSLWLAFFLTAVCVAPWGPLAGAAFLVSAVFTVCFARYITGVLGGLTGDVYGALTLLNEVQVLLVFLLGSQVVG